MDKVKLGRALGYGTRHAAKTLAAVADAATSPAPRAAGPIGQAAQSQPAPPTRPSTQTATTTRRTRAPGAARAAGKSLWAPLATFSSALMLRVAGLFFGLIAWALGTGAWRLRHVLHATGSTAIPPEQTQHFWVFLCFAVLFAYFAVSSFVRAGRRERRAASSGTPATAHNR